MSIDFSANDLRDLLDVVHENLSFTDSLSDLLSVVIKQSHDGEIRSSKSVVVRQCGSQSTGADDAYSMRIVQTQYLGDVVAQVFDVVANTADAKLAEVTKVFSNLSRV